MPDHRTGRNWKIITGPTGIMTQAFIDGQPVHGIRKVKVDFDFRDEVILQLEIMVNNLEIEGMANDGSIIINKIDIADLKKAMMGENA